MPRPDHPGEPRAVARRAPAGDAPIRVLHVLTSPVSLGFLRGQAAHMRRLGFDLEAACSPGEEATAFSRAEGVVVHDVPIARSIAPARDTVALLALVRLIRRVRPTIVHAHTPKGGLLGMLAARLSGVPNRVYHMRGLPSLTASGPLRVALNGAERTACRSAHRVICESESLKAVAVSEGLCPADKARVLGDGSGQGVDTANRFDPSRISAADRRRIREDLGIPGDAIVIGFVGRLTVDKGVRELWRAWQEIRVRHAGCILLVVGDSDARVPLPDDLAAELGSDPRVRRLGWTSRIAEAYSAMDVLVLPSYREGLPNVVLEASAMALPVVTTDAVGCVDAVRPGVTGIRVPARDAAALGAALERYVASPSLRREHGAAGREWMVGSFQPERIWNDLAGEYRRLLESGTNGDD